MNAPSFSPLFVWKLILITVAAGILILVNIDPVKIHVQERRKEIPKKLEKARKQKVTTDVVFFGNSLLNSALPETEEKLNKLLSRALEEVSGTTRSVKAVNLAIDGRSPGDFNDHSDRILGLNPKIIVIQTEMIVGRRGKKEQTQKAVLLQQERQRISNWIFYTKTRLNTPLIPDEGAAQKKRDLMQALSSPAQMDIRILRKRPSKEEREAIDQAHLLRARQHWSGQIIQLNSPEYMFSRSFIEKAQSKGVLVIVVETPISETVARLATEDYLNERKNVVLGLLGERNPYYLRYPKILPDKFFNDYSHANRKGQKVYSKWLAPQLAKLLITKEIARVK